MTDLTATPAPSTSSDPAPDAATLRFVARAAFVAASFLVLLPIFVIVSDVVVGVEASYDPTAFRDPVTWSASPYVGILTAVMGIGAGACLLAIGTRIPEILPARWSRLARAGLTIAATAYFMLGAGGAANYSTQITGTIADVQTDAAVRAMVGYADALATQGIGGAAALGVAALLLSIVATGRREGATRAVAPWLLAAVIVAIVGAVGFGIGGPASAVLTLPGLVIVGISFALSARRARR